MPLTQGSANGLHCIESIRLVIVFAPSGNVYISMATEHLYVTHLLPPLNEFDVQCVILPLIYIECMYVATSMYSIECMCMYVCRY